MTVKARTTSKVLKSAFWRWQLRARSKGKRFDYVRQLAELQWLPADELQRLQQERLHRLLRHAAGHVPYYRTVLRQAGVLATSGLIDIERFTDLPLLEKTNLRERFEDLKSDDLDERRWRYNTTGGSTGEPVRFIQDREYQEWAIAFKMLANSWTGYDFGMPKVILWGSERDLFEGSDTLRVHVRRWLENTVWLNAFRMTREEMKQHVNCINRIRPAQILAYVDSIYELADFIQAEGLQVHSPRAIISAAGTLHPAMRELIERVFRAPVFNHYGAREASGIAFECEAHDGLHVSAITYYLEILRSDGSPAEPGEVGEVALTSLTNYAMPLIRYRIGDVAAWAEKPCTCGRHWPLLRELTGRVTDVFIRKDGGKVMPEYFIHLIGVVFNKGWIQKFQVVQEDYDYVRVRIVTHENLVDSKNRYAGR